MVKAPLASITALVRRLVADPSTSIAIRNECHRLLIAAEGHHSGLIEESLERLAVLMDPVPMVRSDD
jgi:hypothetical protein